MAGQVDSNRVNLGASSSPHLFLGGTAHGNFNLGSKGQENVQDILEQARPLFNQLKQLLPIL